MYSTTIEEKLRTLAYNIAALRKQHHLSKAAMARLLQISVHTLTRLEQGDVPHTLGISILINTYEHFGVLPSVLLGQRLP